MLAIFVDINSLFLSAVRLAHWHWDVSESYSRPLISSIVWSRFFLFSHAVFILIRPSVHPSICRSARFVCFLSVTVMNDIGSESRLRFGCPVAAWQLLTITILPYYFAHMFTKHILEVHRMLARNSNRCCFIGLSGLDFHEDLHRIGAREGLKGRKLQKAMESYAWNITVLKVSTYSLCYGSRHVYTRALFSTRQDILL